MAYDSPAKPFVTISREPGAGATGLGRGLVDALNFDCPDDRRWTLWDRELVGKVVADHNLSARLVEGLLERNHSWMSNFLTSLSFTDNSQVRDEDAIYQKVKKMIQALASVGRVVLVGRGAVFITGQKPEGIHLRLVAPLKNRVNFIAQKLSINERTAAAHIRELERNRRTFFKMHWPNKTLAPDSFTITINTAEVDSASIVQMLRRLIAVKVAAMGQ